MQIPFTKYQGTGNDFVLIDNRALSLAHNLHETFKLWCDRRFGVGADGVILIENSDEADFRMVYFNANGYEGSMCGNGGRCAVHFTKSLGIINDSTTFMAVDGLHLAKINGDLVELKMGDVTHIETLGQEYFIDTGSPHHICFVDDLDAVDTYAKGKAIRTSARYVEKGTNVNFAEIDGDASCKVSTFERGVEDLTLSCGTGVTAVAIAMLAKRNSDAGEYSIVTDNQGGQLSVSLRKVSENVYENIWLMGPAGVSFTGTLTLREG